MLEMRLCVAARPDGERSERMDRGCAGRRVALRGFLASVGKNLSRLQRGTEMAGRCTLQNMRWKRANKMRELKFYLIYLGIPAIIVISLGLAAEYRNPSGCSGRVGNIPFVGVCR